MKCNCESPGFCDTFRKHQSEFFWRKCQEQNVTFQQNWLLLRRIRENDESIFTDEERKLLSDCSLGGNRISEVIGRFGFPPCSSCEVRKEWINLIHSYLRSLGDGLYG